MRDALGHRGPDDSGIAVFDNVGLVHTRLSIVDLSERGHQPMSHPGGSWWLSYNGEIYNHLELRRALGEVGFHGSSDTETLLWSLATGGADAIPRLTGQFAFAALDRSAGELTLCRDRYGIKPLYLARCDDGLWFASELRALLAAGVPAVPVADAWRNTISGSYLGGEATLIDSVTRVGAGTRTVISLADGEVSVSRWHDPVEDVDASLAGRLAARRRSRLTDELEATLRSAVHGSLLADATVGTLCSGGVDSSLITALAAEAQPGIVAFAASFKDDGALDEGLAARRVAKALGIEIEVLDVTPEDWLRGFVAATVHHDGPLANASAVTVSQLAAHAQSHGVKVLLTGEGADELFGGYSMLALQMRAFLPRSHQLVRQLEPKLLGDPKRFLDPQKALSKLVGLALRATRRTTPPTIWTWSSLLSPATGADTAEAATAAYAHHTGERQTLEASLLGKLDYSLCWLLNRMDKNVMQSSVEARVPFLEPEVVRFVLNLPLEARVGPWSKGILRDVARRVLPWSIAHRPKIYGMDFDSATWIEAAADPAFLREGMLRETFAIPRGEFQICTTSADNFLRMRLWSAEVWCRSAIGGHSISQIEQALWG